MIDNVHYSWSWIYVDSEILNKLKKLRPDVWDRESSEEGDVESVDDDQAQSVGKRQE